MPQLPRNPERTRKVSVAELNEFLAFAKAEGGSSYLVALIGCCVALTGRQRDAFVAVCATTRKIDILRGLAGA